MGVFEAIDSLRATRVYEDRAISHEVLSRILTAATRACSSGNTQPWEFVVVTERTVAAHIEHILDKLGFASRHQVGAWADEHGLSG